MQYPKTPENEAQRLEALRSLDILDTSAEERFDRLTRLARRMFDVPIAVVSLVDADRQWFKSRDGLDTEQTPREISFCGHAILDDAVFIVPDALRDERFADNPLVTGDPHIRFYAGCPIKHLDGSRLGAFCIIDREPRVMDEEAVENLRDLARLAERELAAVQLATLDDLTRISNRRGFALLAQKSLNICARHDVPASLVYFDLDGFKAINDDHGHAEGDRALRTFAALMRENFRESDVFARLGGDEFAVLLTNTSNQTAEYICEKFARAVSAFNAKRVLPYALEYSEGIVTAATGKAPEVEDLLKSADALMYARKTGRLEADGA